jgi:hypothetical protein
MLSHKSVDGPRQLLDYLVGVAKLTSELGQIDYRPTPTVASFNVVVLTTVVSRSARTSSDQPACFNNGETLAAHPPVFKWWKLADNRVGTGIRTFLQRLM